MTREAAIERAAAYFDDGAFADDLARRVAIPSTSQEPAGAPALIEYLVAEMQPTLEALGYDCRLLENPVAPACPF